MLSLAEAASHSGQRSWKRFKCSVVNRMQILTFDSMSDLRCNREEKKTANTFKIAVLKLSTLQYSFSLEVFLLS